MTNKQALADFIEIGQPAGWPDYWAMQLDWSAFVDGMARDERITQKQADSWGNPCTPDTFDRWQRRHFRR